MKILPSSKTIAWLSDIRLWVLALFLVRLVSINQLPLEEHAWRQTITLGVARNYLEWDWNFMHPRTVLCDSRTGIQAQEFPFLNYLIAVLWKIAGQQSIWIPRLVVLVISSLGLLAFYEILQRWAGKNVALFATVIWGVSVAFRFARKPMPDVFAISLVFIGLYWAWHFLEKGKWQHWFGFTLLTGLGLLCKMPAAVVLAFFLPALLDQQLPNKRKLWVLCGGLLGVAATAWWYFVWVDWAKETYGFPLFYPETLKVGWEQITRLGDRTLERFYPIALLSKLAYLGLATGIAYSIKKKNATVWVITGASASVMFFFMLKAAGIFSTHTYYIIPFVPTMALLAAYGFEWLRTHYHWIAYGAVALLSVDAINRQFTDFSIPAQSQHLTKLETIVNQYVPKDARVLVNGGEANPMMLYFAHRTGWTVTDRMRDSNWLDGEATVGLDYAIIDRNRWQDTLSYPLLFEDNDFRIYKIKKD